MNKNFFTNLVENIIKVFIRFHTIGFEMMGWAIEDKRHHGLGYVAREMLCGILIILVVIVIDLLIIYGIYILLRRISIMARIKEVKRYNVLGAVTKKEYHESYGIFIATTNTYVHYPERYDVFAEYNGVTGVFDSQDLFQQKEKGDPISLIFYKW